MLTGSIERKIRIIYVWVKWWYTLVSNVAVIREKDLLLKNIMGQNADSQHILTKKKEKKEVVVRTLLVHVSKMKARTNFTV